MNIGDSLKFFRTKKNITQKEMIPQNIDPSTYSRIEGNRRPLRISDLQSIIEKLEISVDEFFSFATLDEEQKWFREHYYYCSIHPFNKEAKKGLVKYYSSIDIKPIKTLRELSNYIAIKCLFYNKWEEIEEISDNEISYIYNLLVSKHYFFQYDYILINNIIAFFTTKQTSVLMLKAFPIIDEEKRDSTTLAFAYNAWLNLISIKLYNEEYTLAEDYIKKSYKFDKSKTNYNFRLNIRYLTHLTRYLQTADPDDMREISLFIKLLKDIGDEEFANRVDEEVRTLTINKSNRDKARYAATAIRLE